jgi:NADH-quinone oxidoreductase subunit E
MKTMEKQKKFEKVMEIIERNGANAARLIPILQEIQDEYRYLPEEIMDFTATCLKIPPARVYGVATFYSHFALAPKGKYIIKVCDGTACHVKRSETLIDAIQKKLKLSDGKNTTDDMLFTMETVSCLGACGLAPVVVINEDIYGQMTADKVTAVLEGIIKKEAANNANN